MRIIGGEARGRRLRSLRGHRVRPTSGRVREALFDILAARVVGSRFLDLFAGVGAVGLEALSRGAAQVVMVEQSERAGQVIRHNVEALGAQGRTRLLRGSAAAVVRGLAASGAKFDIIFMDPPYRDRRGLERTLEEVARAGGILAPHGVVVVEHEARTGPPAATGVLAAERSHRFGDAVLTFFSPHSGGGEIQ